jgi:hypothetical protein
VSAARRTEEGCPAGDDVDVDGVVAAAAACPAVAAVSAGMYGEVATYLPGRRVSGIRVNDTDVEVHVVARAHALQDVYAQIAAATRSLIGGRRLTVAVDDLDIDLPAGAGTSRNTLYPSGSEKS